MSNEKILENIKCFELKIKSEFIPLSIKYEYLKALNDILSADEYSFFAVSELKKDFEEEVIKFNNNIDKVYLYLKQNKNFLNLNKNNEIYKFLLKNLGVLIIMEENYKARKIVEELSLEKNKELIVMKINDTLCDRLKQIVNHLNKYGTLPVQTDRNFAFDDGAYIGCFLARYKKAIYILKEANEYAYQIACYYEKKYLSFDDKLNEVYNYLKQNNNLPYVGDSKVLFSNGEVMSSWFSHNKEKLNKMHDKRADEIIYFFNNRRLSFEQKVDELYNYLVCNGRFSKKISGIRFSDGSFMRSFVKDNKKKLIVLAGTNEKAQAIIDSLNSRKLSFDDKLNEAYNYFNLYKALPSKDSKIRFSDGIYMWYWISYHYDELANSKNKKAQAIVNYLKTSKMDFNDKLNEVYDYLLKYKCLPSHNDTKVLFSNGEIMLYWIGHNKEKLSSLGDSRAIAIINFLNNQRYLSFGEKVKELFINCCDEEYKLNGNSEFSDGVNVKRWLCENKEKIENLKKDNFMAEFIWKNCYRLSFDEKIMEAYNYLTLNGKIPYQSDCETLFSDGVLMGFWFANNKQKIFEDSYPFKEEFILEIEKICPRFFGSVKVKKNQFTKIVFHDNI